MISELKEFWSDTDLSIVLKERLGINILINVNKIYRNYHSGIKES